jgi:quinol monooxygenase YgiN
MSVAPVMASWSFDITPDQLEKMLARVKQTLKHLPAVPGWLGTDCFTNEKQTRVMVLSRWESKDAWGRSVWDKVISESLADFVDRSSNQEFNLYFHIAPEPEGS